MCNMKRISYFFASVALVFGAMGMAAAQETVANEDASVKDHKAIHADEYSLFRGDFFVGIGGGPSVYFGEHDRQMKFHHRMAPAMDVYVGKWLTPSIGVRVAYSGGRAIGGTSVDTGYIFSTGTIYSKPPHKWIYWQEFDYFGVRADFMLNLMNLFGGENPDRFYELSPYIGAGVNKVYNTPLKETCVGLTIGVFNTFRIADAWDIVLDVHGTAVPEKFEHEMGSRPGVDPDGIYSNDGILTAALGIAYNF